MNLGLIADAYPPSEKDFGIILHEFGHVVGMKHEHQSPARGQLIHLKELAVYARYSNHPKPLVKQEVIDQFNISEVSNYSALDLKSIMM